MVKEIEMDEPFLTITNSHVEECGVPPRIEAGKGREYVGYFENSSGEQAVFRYSKNDGARLMLGDAGWQKVYPVGPNGRVGVILGPGERVWLNACLWEVGLLEYIPGADRTRLDPTRKS